MKALGYSYRAGSAIARLGVAVLLSALLVDCHVATFGDWPYTHRRPLRVIKIHEDLDRIRSASSVQLRLWWNFRGFHPPKDPAARERLKELSSELCDRFGGALRETALPNAHVNCRCGGPGDIKGPLPPAPKADVELNITFHVAFQSNLTFLEESAIRFRPIIPREELFIRERGFFDDGIVVERTIAVVEGALWEATLKPKTLLRVWARVEPDEYSRLSAEFNLAQLETALREWANTRAVELANELATALRTQFAHE